MTRSNVPLVMLGVLFAAASAAPAHAQGLGYAIAGPAGFSGFFGSSDAGFHAGGGGEVLVRRIAGAGAEFGIFGNASSALWDKSVNGVFHVPTGGRRLSPFVTGGYTHLSSGEGSFDAWNIGGGIDYWTKDRLCVRVEFRDHVRSDHRGDVHYWALRAGIAFR
jgi:hypothetical protein